MILTATDLRAAGYDVKCACGGDLVFYGKKDPAKPGDTDDRWETVEEYLPGYHIVGQPLPRRARKCSVIACSDCELVIDVSDATDRASILGSREAKAS